jgi:hypothetical protein
MTLAYFPAYGSDQTIEWIEIFMKYAKIALMVFTVYVIQLR